MRPRQTFTYCSWSRIFLVLLSLVGKVCAIYSQAIISQVNTTYSVDFNAMASSTTATLPTGFRIGSDWSTGSAATTQAAGTSGTGILNSTSAGGCYNFGNGLTASATDRALGFLSSTSYTSPRSILYAFTNSTGQTITSLTLSWNYEKYRSGTRAFNWTFFHGNTSAAPTAYSSGDLAYPAELSNTVVYNPPSSISKSITISGLNIPNGTTYYLRWTYTGVGGSTNGQGLAIDDFKIAANRVPCSNPTAQPTDLTFSNIGVSSVDVSFTAPAPAADDYLVLYSLDNTLAINPSNGVDYQAGDVIGDATVVYTGASNFFTANNLSASTTYYFFVFAYNSECSGGPLYNSSSPLTGNATTLAGIPVCSTPATLASGLNLTATPTSISGTFTSSTGVNAYLIVYSTASTPAGSPTNGSEYAVGQSAIGGTVAQANNSTSFVISGLNASTSYSVFIYSINSLNCTGGPVYSSSYASGAITTASYPSCSGISLSAPPTSLSLSINESTVNGSFTAAAGADHYLVVRSTSSSLTATPVNGQSYPVGAALGNGIVVGYTDNTSFTAAGLNASTTYYFFVFSAASNCSATPTPPLYYTTALQGTATTLSSSYQYFFGNFHSHTGYSDGNKDGNCPTPTEAYNFAKTAVGMNFLGVSEHNHVAAGGALSTYQDGVTKATQFNQSNNDFLALFGMEWGTISGGGHVLVYGDGLNDLLGWDPNEYSVYVPKSDYLSSTGLFKTINDYSGNSGLAILAHPNSTDYESLASLPYNATIDDAIVGVALETGPAFSTNTTYSDPGSSMAFLSYYRKLLSIGYRVGPVIDHDNHYTTFGKTTYSRTAVIATSLTRNSIIQALRSMRFYATQDYDTKVDFKINGRMMGAEFVDRFAPVLYVNLTDATNTSDLNNAIIKVMSGVPGSSVVATQLTSITGATLTFTNTAQLDNTIQYYYLDITIGTKRIITSPIWYQRIDASVLPVRLSSFFVYGQSGQVRLEWTTEQEINASHFIIERSVDGRRWDSISMILAKGNTLMPVKYQSYDDSPPAGICFYRLKLMDQDGRYDYSVVRRVLIQDPGEVLISPNPASSRLLLRFTKGGVEDRRVQIFSSDGALKFDRTYLSGAVEVPLSNFSYGSYHLRILTKNGIILRSFVRAGD
jgi:hypothetical protein